MEIVATAEPLIPDDADQQQPLETTGGSDNSTDVNGSAVAEGTMMPSTSVRAARSVPAGQLLAAVPLALTRLIPNGVVARLVRVCTHQYMMRTSSCAQMHMEHCII